MNIARNIQVATNGEEGLNYLKKHCLPNSSTPEACPELIFLDIKMPVMDGFEFLDEYRLLAPEFPEQAIIAMLTSSMSQFDLNRLQQYESVSKFLNKPLTERVVQELVTQFFSEV
jgi:CheY-like chemotaxis protein